MHKYIDNTYVCMYVCITKVMQNICCITRKVFNEFILLAAIKTQRQRFSSCSRFPVEYLRRKQNVRQAKGRRNINMQLNVLPELLKIYNKS